MRCEEMLKRLTAFSSGELATDVHQAMRAHLAECAACRAALARVDAFAGILAGARTPPLPPGLASRVMAAARRRQAAEVSAGWNPRRWWGLTSAPMHAAAAVVLVIGLTVGVVLGSRSALSAGQAPAVAQVDPLETYSLDDLVDAPEGSLADSYLVLVSARNEGGR